VITSNALIDKYAETEPVSPLEILVLIPIALKDPAGDLVTVVLLMVVTVLRPETITVTAPPLALMGTHQTKPHRQPVNLTRPVGQKETVVDQVLIPITVEEMVTTVARRTLTQEAKGVPIHQPVLL
jgi:hypothetical protein